MGGLPWPLRCCVVWASERLFLSGNGAEQHLLWALRTQGEVSGSSCWWWLAGAVPGGQLKTHRRRVSLGARGVGAGPWRWVGPVARESCSLALCSWPGLSSIAGTWLGTRTRATLAECCPSDCGLQEVHRRGSGPEAGALPMCGGGLSSGRCCQASRAGAAVRRLSFLPGPRPCRPRLTPEGFDSCQESSGSRGSAGRWQQALGRAGYAQAGAVREGAAWRPRPALHARTARCRRLLLPPVTSFLSQVS